MWRALVNSPHSALPLGSLSPGTRQVSEQHSRRFQSLKLFSLWSRDEPS